MLQVQSPIGVTWLLCAVLLALLVILETFALSGSASTAGYEQIKIDVKGKTRTCLLQLPPAYDGSRSLPVVIAFHGSRGSGKGMAGTTGFSALADKKNFIAAYPDGAIEPGTWNALFGIAPGGQGVTADDVDDVAFTRALIGLSAA